jgi:hypothetical protein
MITPSLDDPTAVLEFLQAPLGRLYDCLDDGASWADTVMHGRTANGHLHSHLVRFHTRETFDIKADDEEAARDWGLGRVLPNSGIEITRGVITVRALRSIGGAAPSPGRNRARRAYWSQHQQMRLPIDGESTPGANLIADWTIGADHSPELALSKPMGIWRYRGTPQIEWRIPVAFDESGHAVFQPADEDVSVGVEFALDELDEGEAGDLG